MKKDYMLEALKEAKKSYDLDEVPVGAVIVYQDRIIARAHNLKETKQDATGHAELLVIQKACKKLQNWHLDDCTMYVTLEPCLMCAGAMIQSRLKKVVYATSSPKFGYVESVDQVLSNSKNNHIVLVQKQENLECQKLLQSFFQKKRKAPLNSNTKSV